MPANLENSAVVTGLEKVSFHSISKKDNVKERSNYCTIALISHASKVMLKILQAKQTHEKMLKITHYQRNANQNHNEVPFHTSQNGSNPKECSNYCTIALISHASKVMLKILQARLQQILEP